MDKRSETRKDGKAKYDDRTDERAEAGIRYA